MTPILIALCGIPASGKSTLAESVVRILQREMQIKVVSTDDLRDEEYHRDFSPEKERIVRCQTLRIAADYLHRSVSVIHDDTNYYSSMRHDLRMVAQRASAGFAIVHVATPLETAILWNSRRERPVPEHVLRRIAERLDPPGSRYAWDTPVAVIDMSEIQPTAAAEIVIKSLRCVMFPDNEGVREAQSDSSSIASRLDSLTRHVVAEYLSRHPEHRHGRRVSRVRREVLRHALRSGLSDGQVLELLRARLRELE